MLGTDEDGLTSVLKCIGEIPCYETPEDYISQKVYSVLKQPGFPMPAIWFHATRIVDPDSFRREGILPKKKMHDRLYKCLKELSKGLKAEGEYPNNLSVSGKSMINDEGPFAFLFKSVAIEAPGAVHSYIDAPESVEDISGSILQGNFRELVKKFKQISIPCIVSFRAPADERVLRRVIWFAYLIKSGRDDMAAAEAANTFYSGDGVSIPPSDIVDVEVLEKG